MKNVTLKNLINLPINLIQEHLDTVGFGTWHPAKVELKRFLASRTSFINRRIKLRAFTKQNTLTHIGPQHVAKTIDYQFVNTR